MENKGNAPKPLHIGPVPLRAEVYNRFMNFLSNCNVQEVVFEDQDQSAITIQKPQPDGVGLTPYQGEERCYAQFKCTGCKRKWFTTLSWANVSEKCPNCHLTVYPYKQVPMVNLVGEPSMMDDKDGKTEKKVGEPGKVGDNSQKKLGEATKAEGKDGKAEKKVGEPSKVGDNSQKKLGEATKAEGKDGKAEKKVGEPGKVGDNSQKKLGEATKAEGKDGKAEKKVGEPSKVGDNSQKKLGEATKAEGKDGKAEKKVGEPSKVGDKRGSSDEKNCEQNKVGDKNGKSKKKFSK